MIKGLRRHRASLSHDTETRLEPQLHRSTGQSVKRHWSPPMQFALMGQWITQVNCGQSVKRHWNRLCYQLRPVCRMTLKPPHLKQAGHHLEPKWRPH